MAIQDKMRYAAGIDVGGTFVKLALVSEDGNILFEDKLDISKATREEILNTIDLLKLIKKQICLMFRFRVLG